MARPPQVEWPVDQTQSAVWPQCLQTLSKCHDSQPAGALSPASQLWGVNGDLWARFPGFSGGGQRSAAEVTAQALFGWRPVAFQPFHPPACCLSAMLTGSNLLGSSGHLSQNYRPPGWAPQSNLSIHTTVQPLLLDKSSIAALTQLSTGRLSQTTRLIGTSSKQDWKISTFRNKGKVFITFPSQFNTVAFQQKICC